MSEAGASRGPSGPGGSGRTLDGGTVGALSCPNCGAGIVLRGLAWTRTVACASCGSVLDARDPNLAILDRIDRAGSYRTRIPLGTRGQWRGALHEVIGFQLVTITVDGVRYSWDEYVLFNPYHGFRYLTVYEGHWNDVVTVRGTPTSVRGQASVQWQGRRYRHFQTATAVATRVLGEFPWEVRTGDAVTASDYVDPPRMLSSERSEREVTWSQGEYVEGAEVWRAFALPGSPPPRRGIFANQPSFRASPAGVWRAFGLLALLLVALMIVRLASAGNSTVHTGTYAFEAGAPGTNAFVTPSFEMRGGAANVVLDMDTDIENSWISLSYALINEGTGATYDFGREVGHYAGYDEDGAWSEGSRRDRARVGNVPAGRYFLRVESEMPSGASPVHGTLRVRRDVASFVPFLLALLALLVPPLVLSYRAWSFEVKRWAESDHPIVQASTDSDSDDD